jgi:transposase
MAHARRKFFDLHKANKSLIAEQALAQFAALYAIEASLREQPPDVRLNMRQMQAKPLLDKLHDWLLTHKAKIPDGSGTMRAIDYSLKRWAALTHYLDDPLVPIDNNWVENQMRPVALGRKNWLFAGSLRAGKRGAAIMSLIQSAKLNGHDPYAYLKDVLDRLPTQPCNKIEELLPHSWKPAKL